jgi:hypothetical protein
MREKPTHVIIRRSRSRTIGGERRGAPTKPSADGLEARADGLTSSQVFGFPPEVLARLMCMAGFSNYVRKLRGH